MMSVKSRAFDAIYHIHSFLEQDNTLIIKSRETLRIRNHTLNIFDLRNHNNILKNYIVMGFAIICVK